MKPLFLVLVVVAMLLTLAVLFAGIFSMIRGGDFNARYGNRMMQFRVALQALAILLFAIAMFIGR
jgi:Hypoxia induced protein conserved region